MTNYINNTPVNSLYGRSISGTSNQPFVDVFLPRDPDITDFQYYVQQKWLNTATNTYWVLEGFSSSGGYVVPIWIKFGSSSLTETLTGNSGGAVPPTANNINVLGDGVYLTTVGNPATSTLTIEPSGGLPILFTENVGTASAMSGNLNVLGGTAISTTGSGNTITINASPFAFNYTNVNNASSPYTVLATDYYISVDCSGGSVTLNFPNAPTTNKIWVVKDRLGDSSTNNITITTVGGIVDIDGSTSYLLASNYSSVNLIFNGTSYEIY